MTETDRLISLRRMARMLGVKPSWLSAEAAAGRIPGVSAEETWIFDEIAVREALLKRANQVTQIGGAA